MIDIIIDSRENNLINIIKERELDKYKSEISINIDQLDIGDIHINSFIFERKTVYDLLASIKDGRYKEQKIRLLSSGKKITYIIEDDDIISSKNNKNQNILSSIYLHTIYRDNINIVFTKNINDTATFILTLAIKIIENPQYFIENNQEKEYIDCIKVKNKKIDNITPDICYLMQLSQIPSISTTIAKNIQNIYPNMRSFIKALDESDNKLLLLCKIDKIGIEKANKIIQYLHYI